MKVLLAIVLLLSAGAAPTTEPALAQFTSREFRVRITYPAEWIVAEHPSDGDVFSARIPAAQTDGFGIVTLRIDRSQQGSSDAAMLVDLADSLASYVFKAGAEHVKINPDSLGDIPARRITSEKHGNSDPIKAVYIVAVKDRVEYVFNFTGPAANFDSLLPAVNDMLKRFEVLE
jgi:hypothetical protein